MPSKYLKTFILEDFWLFFSVFCIWFDFSFCFFAAAHGHKDIVQILLDNGAKIEHQQEDGKTALMLAGK